MSTKWTDHQNGENILQVHKLDDIIKKVMKPPQTGRITHSIKSCPQSGRTAKTVEIFVHKTDGAITPTKWTDNKELPTKWTDHSKG